MAAHGLDGLDRRIVAMLQENGRLPNLEIARQLGVSEGTIRNRLERLLAEGYVRVIAVPDPALFGFRVHTVVGVQIDLTCAQAVSAQLMAMPEVLSVYLTAGGYDLLVEALLPSSDALLSFLTDRVAVIPGVKRTETYHVLKVFKRAFAWRIPEVPMNRPQKILVVDDDPGFIKIVKAILSRGGYDVVSALHGDEGLQKAHEEQPDLIVLDYMMRSLTEGSTITFLMKDDEQLKNIPILMVSAVGTRQPWWKVRPSEDDLPVDGWLDKPVAPERLLSEVERLIKESNQKKSLGIQPVG